MYTKQWKIKKEKIKILINKYNENSIEENIIKNIFSEYSIIGKITMSNKYNQYINENFKNIEKTEKKEYKKIKI